jgi:hypothetical protein
MRSRVWLTAADARGRDEAFRSPRQFPFKGSSGLLIGEVTRV